MKTIRTLFDVMCTVLAGLRCIFDPVADCQKTIGELIPESVQAQYFPDKIRAYVEAKVPLCCMPFTLYEARKILIDVYTRMWNDAASGKFTPNPAECRRLKRALEGLLYYLKI